MERQDRPETSQRSEILELQRDSDEMSSGSQTRDREPAEAESVQVPRRVVINWERLVGAKVGATQSAHTEIEAAMALADEIQYSKILRDHYVVSCCRRFRTCLNSQPPSLPVPCFVPVSVACGYNSI